MKRILQVVIVLFILILLFSLSSYAQTLQTTAKGTDQTGSSVTSVATGAVATTTGWLAVVATRVSANNTGTISAPTDTAGDTCTLITSSLVTWGAGSGGHMELAQCLNITANASNVMTCHFTTDSFDSCIVEYYSGALTSSALDAVTTGTGTASPVTSGTFSTVSSNEVIVACASPSANSGTFSAGSIGGTTATLDVTSGSSNAGDTGCEHRNVTSTQSSITAAMANTNVNGNAGISVASFKASTSGVSRQHGGVW
jgi:hypothetical protein